MSTPLKTRFAALSFALLATLATLAGIEQLAGGEVTTEMAQAVSSDKA